MKTGVLHYQVATISPLQVQTDDGDILVDKLKNLPSIMKEKELSSIIVVGDVKFFPPIEGVISENQNNTIILRKKG